MAGVLISYIEGLGFSNEDRSSRYRSNSVFSMQPLCGYRSFTKFDWTLLGLHMLDNERLKLSLCERC